MKSRKVSLYDGKEYEVCTLPLSKTMALRKRLKESRDKNAQREYAELSKKIEKDEATFEELDRFETLAEGMEGSLDNMLLIVRESLAVKNTDFAFKRGNDEAANAHNNQVDNNLKDLLDMNDMNRIMNFALTGVWENEESAVSEGTTEG